MYMILASFKLPVNGTLLCSDEREKMPKNVLKMIRKAAAMADLMNYT
jgi:hypothetical protein